MSRFHGLALLSALLVLAAAPLTRAVTNGGGSDPSGTPGAGGTTEPPPPPAITTLGGVLSRAGLSAEALTAAGVSSNEVAEVVADADTFIGGSGQTLASLDQSFVAAKIAEEALRRQVKKGTASQGTVSQLASARVTRGQAESSRDTFLDGVFQAGVASLSTAQVNALTSIRANRSWHLDVAYLVVDRTEPEWVALSDALAAERVALAEQESTPPLSQALITQVSSDPTVSLAKTSLGSYLAGVQTAWNSAVSQ